MSARAFALALLGLLAVVAVGSVLDVMEVDAAQYAGMSRDMLRSGDLTHLHFRGADYLDKPPLLFWLSALSFKVFGVYNWSYKLPSILFAFLALYATYRFTALHYTREQGRVAALMLGLSAAFLLMTNDVRCDTMLMGSVITAIWLGAAWLEQRRWWQLFGCAVAIASGMLAKGPMGAVAPLLALGGEVVLKRKWNVLKDPALYVLPLVVGSLLVPMCVGLYEQHGMHGLRFYFWEQSFGRITGENRWKDDSSYFFFTHEVLWQTLPWTPFALVGLWRSVAAMVRRHVLQEYASAVGSLLVFIALSLSHFKLPHYLYVILPLLAVQGSVAWSQGRTIVPRVAQWVVLVLLYAAVLGLLLFCFPDGAVCYIVAAGALPPFLGWYLRSRNDVDRMRMATTGSWLLIAWVVNAHIYPAVLRYQANAQVGRIAQERGLDVGHFYGMQVAGTALDLYAGFPVRWLSNAGEAGPVIAPGVVIYTDAARLAELRAAGLVPRTVETFPNYEVQLLGLDFLLPASRQAVVQERYLLTY